MDRNLTNTIALVLAVEKQSTMGCATGGIILTHRILKKLQELGSVS